VRSNRTTPIPLLTRRIDDSRPRWVQTYIHTRRSPGSLKEARMGWTTQRQKRKKGWYYQALYKEGGKPKRTVALGTLTDEQHEWARANLSFSGSKLLDLTSPE